jgi:hypothetical protein
VSTSPVAIEVLAMSSKEATNLVPVVCPIALPIVCTFHSERLIFNKSSASNTAGDVDFLVSVRMCFAAENSLSQLTDVPDRISRLIY